MKSQFSKYERKKEAPNYLQMEERKTFFPHVSKLSLIGLFYFWFPRGWAADMCTENGVYRTFYNEVQTTEME